MPTKTLDASPDQRRAQMLHAAAELIAERGFSDTRIADVALRVGASPALVIYYFGTKDSLLTAALRHSEDSFYAAAEEMLAHTPSLRTRLDTLVRLTCVRQGADDEIPGSWGLWFDLWAQAFRHPEVARDRIDLDQRWRSMILRVVEEAVASGEIGAVDAEEFSLGFAALLDGLSIQVALEDPAMSPERAHTIAMRFAARELGADWGPQAKPRRKASGSRRRS
ncbi:MAG: TetR/AcrR family transcriptional regulator [Nocardioidaceae bacterium]